MVLIQRQEIESLHVRFTWCFSEETVPGYNNDFSYFFVLFEIIGIEGILKTLNFNAGFYSTSRSRSMYVPKPEGTQIWQPICIYSGVIK